MRHSCPLVFRCGCTLLFDKGVPLSGQPADDVGHRPDPGDRQHSGRLVAARLAVECGSTFVRWVLIAVVAVSGAKLLGVFDWVGWLF